MRIAINGIGIAGPTLAWWLRYYGHEPVMFEIAPELRTGGYVIDFWGHGYDIAEKMGILPEIHQKGYRVEDLKVMNDRGQVVTQMSFDAMRDVINDRFTTIPRGDLAAAIYHACEGIDARFGTSIIGIDQVSDGVQVTLSNGVTESFDLVVGADGLHSAVRSIVFGPQSDYEVPLGYHVAAFYLDHYRERDEDTYILHTKVGRQVGRFSLSENKTLFLFTWREDLTGNYPQNEQEEKQALRKVFHDMGWELPHILERMDEVEDIYFDKVSQVHMNHWTKGRVALVGDTASCVSLLAGEGSGLGMLEAYVLAGELHTSKNHEQAFKNYEKKLGHYLRKKQQSALRFAGFFAPKNKFQIFIRNLGIKFLSGKWFTRTFLASDFDLPKYK